MRQASNLANYSIVITTSELCAAEFTKHCNEAASKRKDSESKHSLLHSIRWLRLIVDEGHDIGRSNNKDNIGRNQKRTPKIQKQKRYEAKNHLRQLLKASDFILEIAAERRWVMSDGLQGKEEKWKEWENEIINPCLKQDPSDWGNLSKC